MYCALAYRAKRSDNGDLHIGADDPVAQAAVAAKPVCFGKAEPQPAIGGRLELVVPEDIDLADGAGRYRDDIAGSAVVVRR